MIAVAKSKVVDIDQRVTLYTVPWAHYEMLLEDRGDSAVPRMSYLKGTLELMSPGKGHEQTKKMLARLIEAYADELAIRLNGFGSWTLRSAPKESGCEPDECYIRGRDDTRETPDLAIEVIFTSGGLDKLEIYRRLGVQEVWCWEEGRIRMFELRGDSYIEIERSRILPELDFVLITELVEKHEDQYDAVSALRATLRARR